MKDILVVKMNNFSIHFYTHSYDINRTLNVS